MFLRGTPLTFVFSWNSGGNRDIFVTVCADLVQALDGCLTNESRRSEIADFLTRWSRFFERYGQEGLSSEEQRGLYGELRWLQHMVHAGIEPLAAVNSWKGCRRTYHDYEANGHVVEVKTTMTKEPRKVQINNERQLDGRGLNSLYLFVLTLTNSGGGGETLHALVQSLRGIFSGKPVAYTFEHSLREAGYLDIHVHLYNNNYSSIKRRAISCKRRISEYYRCTTGAWRPSLYCCAFSLRAFQI